MKFNGPKIGVPSIALAPMEGVTDFPMRQFLSQFGGIDYCVSEFLRVTDRLYPARVFRRHMPEIDTECRTTSGVAVQLQLLGGNAEVLAQNAVEAGRIGVTAIDLNFGCPAPTVNRHDGGAVLLKSPDRIYSVVRAVREAVPKHIPVSAKLRLGWENCDDIFVNAEMAQKAGADWITIHARTRMAGYRPPVYWGYIRKVRENSNIPIVANGDIWNREDFLRCQEETRCEHYMLGRGLLTNPFLAREIIRGETNLEKIDWLPLVKSYADQLKNQPRFTDQTCARVKQWLNFATKAQTFHYFNQVKITQSIEQTIAVLESLGTHPG